MKKLYSALYILSSILILQNCAKADFINSVNTDKICLADDFQYTKLISYNPAYNNIFTTRIPDVLLNNQNNGNTIASLVDDDFTLDMDIDIESKKRLRPKADILNGFKVEDKQNKCVEKIIQPKMKHKRINNERFANDEENLDIDKVEDIKSLTKKSKKPKIAKTETKERISWFNIFRRKPKTETIASNNTQTVDDNFDIDQITDTKNQTARTLIAEQKEQISVESLENKVIERPVKTEKVPEQKIEIVKQEKVPVKTAKVKPVKEKPLKIAETPQKTETNKEEFKDIDSILSEEAKNMHPVSNTELIAENDNVRQIAEDKNDNIELNEDIDSLESNLNGKKVKPVKVAKVKPVKEKPVKIAKVSEPKVKPVKQEKVKPVKVAKVKPVKEKPVKIAKVSEPKVKPAKQEKVKPVKVAKVKPVKEKPVKIAKVSEPKVKPAKQEKVKPVKVAKVKPVKEKPVKIAKVSEPKVKPVKQEKVKPVKVAKVKPVKEKPVKIAKVSEPKVKPAKQEKVKPVRVAKVKSVKEKSVKIAKVSEPKVKPVKQEKVKPVKVAKTTPSKTDPVITAKQKPVSIFDSSFNKTPVKTANVKPIKQEKVKPVKVARVKPVKEKPVKVAKVSEPKVKPVKQEKVKPVKVARVKPVKEKPVKVAKVSEPKVKPVKVAKTKPVNNIKNVSRTTAAPAIPTLYYLKSNAVQEVSVNNSFEELQSRLPLIRKPFDNEDI